MKRQSERGVALVLALLLTSVMSVLAVSLTFLSQSETFATMNYRMMTQARFAGESAVQKAGTFLMDTTAFPGPGATSADLLLYDRTKSPVTLNGTTTPVVLEADPNHSTYPHQAAKDAFAALFQVPPLEVGFSKLAYTARAELISLQSFEAYGRAAGVAATWRVTGVGALVNSANSTVTVTSIIERPKVSANAYAAFATGNTCGAMYFHGNITINSYDSRNPIGVGATPTMQNWGGNVGTNGNLHIQGSVAVQGNLSTPRTGVGTCSAGAVTALTETGAADVTGSLIRLPGEAIYPVPVFTAPTTPVTIQASAMDTVANQTALCTSLGLTYGTTCTFNAATNATRIIVDATDGAGHGALVTMPSVTVANGVQLVFQGRSTPAAEININSLNVANGGRIEIEANMAGGSSESVVLKFAGKNADGTEMATPFSLPDTGWKQNSPQAGRFDASTLQIIYGGTGQISMYGNAQSAATIYAPNASFLLQGTTDLYGSILARSVTNGGTANIHFDRRLLADFFVPGRPMASNFSWEAY